MSKERYEYKSWEEYNKAQEPEKVSKPVTKKVTKKVEKEEK